MAEPRNLSAIIAAVVQKQNPVALTPTATNAVAAAVLDAIHDAGCMVIRTEDRSREAVNEPPPPHVRLGNGTGFGDGYGSSTSILADPNGRVYIRIYDTHPGENKAPTEHWTCFLPHEEKKVLDGFTQAFAAGKAKAVARSN